MFSFINLLKKSVFVSINFSDWKMKILYISLLIELNCISITGMYPPPNVLHWYLGYCLVQWPMQILPQCIYQCISRRSHHTAYINPLSFLCRYKHISYLRQGTTLLMFMTQIYVSFDRLPYCTNYFGKMEIANRILFRLDQNYHFIILKEWFLIPLEPLSEIHVNKCTNDWNKFKNHCHFLSVIHNNFDSRLN